MSLPDKRSARAGQYLRVSQDVSGRARSVDEQRDENERAAAQHGWTVTVTLADPNRSASRYTTRARENYQRLLDDITSGRLDVVILWEPSRGSRKVSEWVELIEAADRSDVVFYVTSHRRTYDPKIPRDRRSLLEDAVDSDFESGKTSERVLRAVKAAADAGRPWGALPFGYAREYTVGSASPVRQVPDPETAPIVQEIVARVLGGEALHRIAVDLNRRGVPTPQMARDRRTGREGARRGGWNNPKLRALLSSPTISGWRVHQGQRHRLAEWEPLVNAADHAAVLAIINDPDRRTQRGTAARHLLSGVATCGAVFDGEVCGAWLRHFTNRGLASYGCHGRNATNTAHVTRRAEKLEALVVKELLRKMSDPTIMSEFQARLNGRDAEAEAAAKEVAHLEAQIKDMEAEAQERVRAKKASARSALLILDGLHEQLEAAQARLPKSHRLPVAVLQAVGPGARDWWDSPAVQNDIELQRLTVRALIRVVVRPSSLPRGTHRFDYSTVDLLDPSP